MTDSDYLSSKPPEFLPEHLRDPREKKEFEREGMQEAQQFFGQAKQYLSNQPRQEESDTEAVHVRNNRAQSLHVEGMIIPGQLTTDTKGPFERIPKKKIKESYLLSSLFDGERPSLSTLSKDDYKKEFKEFFTKRAERIKKQETGSDVVREDSEYDIKKHNLKVIRQQG